MEKETKKQLREYLYFIMLENDRLEKEVESLKEKIKNYETTTRISNNNFRKSN